MPSPLVTMADVARTAGVGMATVSRALSGTPGVAEKTRTRVITIADELGYVISPEASGLARGATKRVAVVVPHLSRWFFSSVVEAMEAALREAELDILLYHVPDSAARHAFFERLPARRKVDAVIVVGLPVDEREQQRLELMGVQIIALGGQTAAFPFVRIDDRAASRVAVEHLISLGHRRVAMIEAVDPELPGWPKTLLRSSGYYDALDGAGVPVSSDLVVRIDWGGESGALAMERLLELSHPPSAVYAHSDEVALGAMRTIRRAGLRVPEDVSVIGIDDHPLAALTDLTTVRQPTEQQGAAAAAMLLDLLAKRDTDTERTFPTELIIRGSTAALGSG